MATTVVGFFDNVYDAHAAIEELFDNGFVRNDIGLVANDEFHEPVTTPVETGADNNTAAGAGGGAVIGGIAGLLLGLGAFVVPGVGWVLAAGPLAATLVGAGIGAAAGGLFGALVSLGVPEADAHTYAEGVRYGGALVTLHCSSDLAEHAADILSRRGGTRIHQVDERADVDAVKSPSVATEDPVSGLKGFDKPVGVVGDSGTASHLHQIPIAAYPGRVYHPNEPVQGSLPVHIMDAPDDESDLAEDPDLEPRTSVVW